MNGDEPIELRLRLYALGSPGVGTGTGERPVGCRIRVISSEIVAVWMVPIARTNSCSPRVASRARH